MPQDASHGFGAYLREARERKGITLRQIATSTKISVLALEALERDDISRLPGGIFSRAFVRAYAQEAGLDVEDAVRRFVARFPEASMEEAPAPYDPNPEGIGVDEQWTPGRGWRALGWLLPFLLVVAYFGFGGRLPFAQNPPPAATSPAIPAPPPATIPATQPATLPEGAGAQSPADAAATGSAAAAPAEPVQASRSTPIAEGALRLTLSPRDDCWVSVRVDGVTAFSGLMRGGDRRELDLKGEISLTVGDAAAFGFSINGQPGRPLGEAGRVITARFTPETFRDYVEPR